MNDLGSGAPPAERSSELHRRLDASTQPSDLPSFPSLFSGSSLQRGLMALLVYPNILSISSHRHFS